MPTIFLLGKGRTVFLQPQRTEVTRRGPNRTLRVYSKPQKGRGQVERFIGGHACSL
jgi:hypothetical protein